MKVLSRVSKLPLRGVLTVIGGFLVHCTLSSGYIFGNMTPYLTSYLRVRSWSYNVTYSDTVWISTSNYITMAVSMPLLGWVEQRLPPRICTLIGGLVFSSGILLTHITMKHSLALTVLTYGVINGAGRAVIYPSAVKSALQWFPKRSGLITGVIICGVGLGTFVFNQVITAFINPENFIPEDAVQDDLFFTQDFLLDRVPNCFLLLGGVYIAIQLLAVFFLMSTPTYEQEFVVDVDTNSTQPTKDVEMNNLEIHDAGKNANGKLQNTDSPTKHIQRDSKPNESNTSPCQVLRTNIFYVLWFFQACFFLGIFFVMNFYKTFAQTFIHDDHFLTLAGSAGALFNTLGRPCWGAVADKLGYRESLVIICGVCGVATATLTLCEYGGKVMLMIWLCLIYGTFSGFHVLMPSICVYLYGQKYYSVNYGLFLTHQIVIQLIGALLTSQIKSTIGWKGVMYIGAGGVIFSFFLSLGVLVQHRLVMRKQTTEKQERKEFTTHM